MERSLTETGDAPAVSNGRIARFFALPPWLVSAFAFILLSPLSTRSPAYQRPAPQSGPETADKLELTAAEEKNSYEVYSMLLRMEMGPEWNIRAWAISQETQTFPHYANRSTIAECLQPSQGQKSVYLPLIEDYVSKNKKKFVLERKFDLPDYVLIPPSGEMYHLTALFPLLLLLLALGP